MTIPVLFAAMAIVGCQTATVKTEIASDIESTPLSASDIQTLLVGNTYPFSKGGIYLSSSTEAIALWDGKTEETSWYATDDSSFCYDVEMFGGEECLLLAQTDDGNYLQTSKHGTRKVNASNIKAGKAF